MRQTRRASLRPPPRVSGLERVEHRASAEDPNRVACRGRRAGSYTSEQQG